MRLPVLPEIVALASLAFFAAAPDGSAEEQEATVASTASPCEGPVLKLAKKPTTLAAQTAQTASAVADCTTNDRCPVDPATGEQPSHRRGAEKKRAALAADTHIRRLDELCGDEVVLQPILVRSTLADAMRRVALWGDCCPICGHVPSDNGHKSAEARDGFQPSPRERVLDVEDAQPVGGAAPAPLRAGEPAQVILDTQKRLGKSVTDGTEFGGSPDLLIQWIRILDEENRRRQLALEETAREEPLEPLGDAVAANTHSQVDALRKACRQVQEAADLLEEQDLFESADSLRRFADILRRQSRHKLSQSGQSDDMPISQPRHARTKSRLTDVPVN